MEHWGVWVFYEYKVDFNLSGFWLLSGIHAQQQPIHNAKVIHYKRSEKI